MEAKKTGIDHLVSSCIQSLHDLEHSHDILNVKTLKTHKPSLELLESIIIYCRLVTQWIQLVLQYQSSIIPPDSYEMTRVARNAYNQLVIATRHWFEFRKQSKKDLSIEIQQVASILGMMLLMLSYPLSGKIPELHNTSLNTYEPLFVLIDEFLRTRMSKFTASASVYSVLTHEHAAEVRTKASSQFTPILASCDALVEKWVSRINSKRVSCFCM